MFQGSANHFHGSAHHIHALQLNSLLTSLSRSGHIMHAAINLCDTIHIFSLQIVHWSLVVEIDTDLPKLSVDLLHYTDGLHQKLKLNNLLRRNCCPRPINGKRSRARPRQPLPHRGYLRLRHCLPSPSHVTMMPNCRFSRSILTRLAKIAVMAVLFLESPTPAFRRLLKPVWYKRVTFPPILSKHCLSRYDSCIRYECANYTEPHC